MSVSFFIYPFFQIMMLQPVFIKKYLIHTMIEIYETASLRCIKLLTILIIIIIVIIIIVIIIIIITIIFFFFPKMKKRKKCK